MVLRRVCRSFSVPGQVAIVLAFAANCVVAQPEASWPILLVDTSALTVTVSHQGRAQKTFADISIGRFGATLEKERGDNKTPLGSYRVAWVKRGAPFLAFIGIDYPSVVDAERGLAAALISPDEHRDILEAHAAGRLPPQNTALGGQLGLHGLGKADSDVHANYNWTRGCMALTNDQIAELLPWISLGMRVEIR